MSEIARGTKRADAKLSRGIAGMPGKIHFRINGGINAGPVTQHIPQTMQRHGASARPQEHADCTEAMARMIQKQAPVPPAQIRPAAPPSSP